MTDSKTKQRQLNWCEEQVKLAEARYYLAHNEASELHEQVMAASAGLELLKELLSKLQE